MNDDWWPAVWEAVIAFSTALGMLAVALTFTVLWVYALSIFFRALGVGQ